MDLLVTFLQNFISLSADASPWLLLGLLIAGLMKAWVPSQILSKHLGKGSKSVVKAALIGAPLPLCSCGVIPVVTELHKSGASDAATASFLVATPETGVDSISVSYAMLGPFFAVYRPITAIFSAIITGLLVENIKNKVAPANINTDAAKKVSCCSPKAPTTSCCDSAPKKSTCSSAAPVKSNCCSTKTLPASCCDSAPKKSTCSSAAPVKSSCCSTKPPVTSCCSSTDKAANTFIQKNIQGIQYACSQLIDDIIIWLLIGLLFATLVQTFVPPSFLLSYGSGLPAMLMMILISIPMYICATASTPIAAGFILAGLSPGTALVFMMAGPATNISTLGVVKKTMGSAVLTRYLFGISGCAILFGLLLDWGVEFLSINVAQQMQHSHALIPFEVGVFCTLLLTFLAIKPLRKLCF